MKNFSTVVFIILLTFVFVLPASADDRNPLASSYVFLLYYDNGQLFADRDFEFVYDVIPEEFVPETYNTQFPFKGEIVNFKNEVAAEFLFDPRRGNPDFLKGKISVKAPYVPDGQKAVFYDSRGRTLLTVFVSESSFCDDNGVCNFDRGEDENTCPNDCRGVVAPPPPEQDNGGQISMLMVAIYVLIIAGGALGGWFGWKWWKGRREQPTTPPVSPTPQLPQNPNVQQ